MLSLTMLVMILKFNLPRIKIGPGMGRVRGLFKPADGGQTTQYPG